MLSRTMMNVALESTVSLHLDFELPPEEQSAEPPVWITSDPY